LLIQLPPPPEALPPEDVQVQERNIFKIQINSSDRLLVEGDPWFSTNRELTNQIKVFILNNGQDPASSDSPLKAIVSLKADRGTTHKKFIEVLDAAQAAYHEIYAERAGVTVVQWREISSEPNASPENRAAYDKGRDVGPDGTAGIPMALSIAEPTKIGG
jgi:biopolymer transport protein ExbD